MASLQRENLLSEKLRIGIVGMGCVGSQLHRYLQALNFQVLLNDPPRQQTAADFKSDSLADIAKCDLICLHVPLEKSGVYPTYHLIDEEFLKQCKPGAVILNASRGAVISPDVIKRFKDRFIWCLDVWEDEPVIDLDLLSIATIATPHIAGHTVEAKHRATEMIYQEFCRSFGLQLQKPNIELSAVKPHFLDTKNWQDLVLSVYNPLQETRLFKKNMNILKLEITHQTVDDRIKDIFIRFRKQQGNRYELGLVKLKKLMMILLKKSK